MNSLAHNLFSLRALLLVLIVGSTPVVAQNKLKLIPLGSFSNHSGNGEHTYGYQSMLWRNGTELIGQLIYWDGDLEGMKGDFTNGEINTKTGEISFNVTVKKSSVSPVEQYTAKFNGTITGNKVVGVLIWQGKKRKHPGDKEVEKLTLKSDLKIKLMSLPNIKVWKNKEESRYLDIE